jgi:hypothetical protein
MFEDIAAVKPHNTAENEAIVNPVPEEPATAAEVVPFAEEKPSEIPATDAGIEVEVLIPSVGLENVETPVVEVEAETPADAEPVIAPTQEDKAQKRASDADEDILIEEVISVEDLI